MFVVFGIFLQNNLHSVFVVFVVFEIIFPKKSCPVLICLTCLMCLMCLTFSCVWCGFFLLHLKCLHFLSLKLSPSSSVFDVFNLCFGSFFLNNILHPVFDVFHVNSEFFPNSYPVLMCLTCLMCFVCLVCFFVFHVFFFLLYFFCSPKYLHPVINIYAPLLD